MVGLLLVSHGDMAKGIKSALDLIVGDTDSIETSSLVAGQDFESLKEDVLVKARRANQGEGVLVYVDLLGASPYNASLLGYTQLIEEGINIRVVTGMNLPMILESSLMRQSMDLDELADLALATGQMSIIEGVSVMKETVQDEDEGDY